jgi:Protein of unknown function (DUF1573)
LSASAGAAALEWKTTHLALKTEIGQEQAVAIFPFRNAGDKPVRIIALNPSCSCMAAEPGKELYAPGESGEIRVELALIGYVGHLQRSVAVETDDPGHRFTDLTLTVDIPEPVALTPRFLFWRVGDQPEEKSLEIVVAEPAKTTISGIECDSARFAARLSPGSAGRYRLLVKPADAQQPADAAIHVKTVIGGRAQDYIVYVAVKPPAGP